MNREIKALQLKEWQKDWAEKASNILLSNHGYIDTSRMGSGKTYVTLWLAKKFNFKLIIICPVIMMDVWRKTAEEYDVEIIEAISYQSLRSQSGSQPKHGLLNRYDNVTEGGQRQTTFTVTPKYLEIIKAGVLVVCDEIQNIKNNTAQTKACSVLLRPIIENGGLSRYAFLSGTPFDKEEHALNLLKLIGYIRHPRLYYYLKETNEMVLEGMQELIDACYTINHIETQKILVDIPPTHKNNMTKLCYYLYINIIKNAISGSMPSPTTIIGNFDVKNGFYKINNEKTALLHKAVNDLAQATNYNDCNGNIIIQNNNMGAITTALVNIENSKTFDMARVATDILSLSPNNKLIIAVNFNSSLSQLFHFLSHFNPLVLNGEVKNTKRQDIVHSFQSNVERRLLLMNTAVGGVGISLHDTVGTSPRFMLISPSYHILTITQAAGRIFRDGTLSNATVRMFYGRDDGIKETSILSALALKSSIVRSTLDNSVGNDFVLPGDYPTFLED